MTNKKWKEAENISYSVYGTPMESTKHTSLQKCYLQKRFGIRFQIIEVPDIRKPLRSYHEYHVSELNTNAFDKLDTSLGMPEMW